MLKVLEKVEMGSLARVKVEIEKDYVSISLDHSYPIELEDYKLLVFNKKTVEEKLQEVKDEVVKAYKELNSEIWEFNNENEFDEFVSSILKQVN